MENNDLVPFWGNSTSFVWKDFAFEYEIIDGKKVINKSKAVCKLCRAKLAYCGGTSTLGNHLRTKHKVSSTVPIAKKDEGGAKKQSLIKESFGVRPPLPAARKQMLDRNIENFVHNKLRPLSIVDDPSFADLVTSLEPQY